VPVGSASDPPAVWSAPCRASAEGCTGGNRSADFPLLPRLATEATSLPDTPYSLAHPTRLAALEASELLDTGAIPALDRVVRTTARMLRVPVAQLNVITPDRQIPVSHVGGEAWGVPVGLERSLCQQVIRSGERLVVENARDHPAARDNRAVREDGIAAYMSVPIVSPRAEAPLATLCVVDFTPRRWTGDEVEAITDLAGWALSEIELRTVLLRDQVRSREALRESEQRYRTLFASLDEGVCVIEMMYDQAGRATDYRFVEANPAFQEQAGVGDPAGRTIRELVPDLGTHWFRRYQRVAETGEPERFTEHEQSRDRWYEVYAFRLGRADEHRVAVLFRDITEARASAEERERLLAEVRVERERLSEVIRRAPAFMVVLRGREHVIDLVNDAYQELVGPRADIGKPLFDAIPEARGQGFEELLDRVLEGGEPFTGRGLPLRLKRAADAELEERILDVAYLPLTEVDGTRSGVMVVGTDVTDQVKSHRAVEAARDRAERLQALTAALARTRTLNDVADVVVADMVVALGARTGALAGRDPDGEHMLLLRTIGFPDDVVEGVRRQPLSLQSPLTACFKTQSSIWIESRTGEEGLDQKYPPIAPVWDRLGVNSAAFVPLVAGGETVGVISFAFERERRFTPEQRAFFLTLGQQAALAVERARLFEAERSARDEAERANRVKSEFLAVMSHELRTPLNAIGGYAELMAMGIRGPVNPQQREDLQRVQSSQRHLLGLINEVLNYAKLETGTVHYSLEEVRLHEVLTSAETLVAPQVQQRDLTLSLNLCEPPAVVRADVEKLRQILVNLLSNAIKFTDRGGRVELGCRAGDGLVHVFVRDTGIGISPDQLQRIFEPFVQVRSDLTRTAEGTGLGLAISRDLARGMGGDLTAESEIGVGSTFTLTLPATSPS
jgi:PAS domain S-box-containing protein